MLAKKKSRCVYNLHERTVTVLATFTTCTNGLLPSSLRLQLARTDCYRPRYVYNLHERTVTVLATFTTCTNGLLPSSLRLQLARTDCYRPRYVYNLHERTVTVIVCIIILVISQNCACSKFKCH